MEKIVFDLKTKKTEIVEVPDIIYEEPIDTESQIEHIPTESERLEALEMAMLEIAEVLANG